MYPSVRRFDINSIGLWKHTIGRPTETSEKKWTQRCNFAFRVLHKIESLPDNDTTSMMQTDKNCGWIIEVFSQNNETKECYISTEHAASNMHLRRKLMSIIAGTICRITSDDFLTFVDEDTRLGISSICVTNFCGKIAVGNKHVWAFPEIILDNHGQKIVKRPIFVSGEFLQKRSNGETIPLPSKLPMPKPISHKNHLGTLSRRMQNYYGPRFIHAVHLLTSVLKAIHFDTLLETEHFVSVANISGPPNIGKTFVCAIALAMLNAPGLMMSRCTPSAMIDAAHVFKNLLIVWDDPRDCSQNQLSSIVHEAFHGHANSTVSRGLRRYHSSLIIGTQEHMLGMSFNANNVATFSRLSHINMENVTCGEWEPDTPSEAKLQACLPSIDDCFARLITSKYDVKEVDTLHARLNNQFEGLVISRCTRIAAIDWYFAKILQENGFEIDTRELTSYFTKYMSYLSMHCSKLTPVEHMCRHLKQLLHENVEIPKVCFKHQVTVDLKQFGPTECFAIFPKEFIHFLHKHIPDSKSYTKEQIHAQIKHEHKFGEVCKNVAFSTNHGTQVRRAIVIRKKFIA